MHRPGELNVATERNGTLKAMKENPMEYQSQVLLKSMNKQRTSTRNFMHKVNGG